MAELSLGLCSLSYQVYSPFTYSTRVTSVYNIFKSNSNTKAKNTFCISKDFSELLFNVYEFLSITVMIVGWTLSLFLCALAAYLWKRLMMRTSHQLLVAFMS